MIAVGMTRMRTRRGRMRARSGEGLRRCRSWPARLDHRRSESSEHRDDGRIEPYLFGGLGSGLVSMEHSLEELSHAVRRRT